jgi:deoxyribodipyrimidine photo-lyase
MLQTIAKEAGATAVYWNRRYEPAARVQEEAVNSAFQSSPVETNSFNGSLLIEPWAIANKSGKPFRVFTPFWRACLNQAEPTTPLDSPDELPLPEKWPATAQVPELDLLPSIPWHQGIEATWNLSEAGANETLDRFVHETLHDYDIGRDRPDLHGTSRLSPHLHFGTISPRQVWHAIAMAEDSQDKERYLSEIGWREFAHHLLYHFPHTTTMPMQETFTRFPWRDDADSLRAWQQGRTGFPIVDAGMRELWHTGWMHNRVRMIAASFLTKDLLIPWQEGARWFWDTLVDANLANNSLGWQWTAGCGADAAPFFRVFNPMTQGAKFDPDGEYVMRWIPELADLPNKNIHAPWQAPTPPLETIYPAPIVDHKEARLRALAAYEETRTT